MLSIVYADGNTPYTIWDDIDKAEEECSVYLLE